MVHKDDSVGTDVLLVEIRNITKNLDSFKEYMGDRLSCVESLRDRVVVLETSADHMETRVVNCEGFIDKLKLSVIGLLVSCVLSLGGLIWSIQTFRLAKNENYIATQHTHTTASDTSRHNGREKQSVNPQ